jgi:hypothetical protein
MFKQAFGCESYLLCIKDHKLRRTLSRLRLSSHDLCIETGRYTKPKTPVENRICTLCNVGIIEDEYHFIMECERYSNERAALFDRLADDYFSNSSKRIVLTRLLSCKKEEVIFCLCKFVSKCFKKRKEVLGMANQIGL